MIYILLFIITLVITPVVETIALKKGFTDDAGGDPLKIHRQPVALLGGLIIVVALAIGIFFGRRSYVVCCDELIGIVVGGLIVFGVGLWDDIREIRPIFRLLTHILAGVIVLLAGLRMNFIPIWWIIIPFTIIYVAGAINAFNVLDGMDGLCAGVSLISCIGFFFLGLNSQNNLLMVLSAILFMSLLGFLPYNFYPAKIFLGNAGSGLIGFLMGVIAVMATSKPLNFVNFVVPILIICVPVFDMTIAILRRLMRGSPLFAGDRDHIYDLLLKKDMSQPKVWTMVCGAQFILMALAVFIEKIYG